MQSEQTKHIVEGCHEEIKKEFGELPCDAYGRKFVEKEFSPWEVEELKKRRIFIREYVVVP